MREITSTLLFSPLPSHFLLPAGASGWGVWGEGRSALEASSADLGRPRLSPAGDTSYNTANPSYILNPFMMRNAGDRTRIGDVQHNVEALFLF